MASRDVSPFPASIAGDERRSRGGRVKRRGAQLAPGIVNGSFTGGCRGGDSRVRRELMYGETEGVGARRVRRPSGKADDRAGSDKRARTAQGGAPAVIEFHFHFPSC